MGIPFLNFILEAIGAFLAWAFKGFKGKYSDEFSRPNDLSKKSWRNTILSFLFIMLILFIIEKFSEKEEKNRTYTFEYKINE